MFLRFQELILFKRNGGVFFRLEIICHQDMPVDLGGCFGGLPAIVQGFSEVIYCS